MSIDTLLAFGQYCDVIRADRNHLQIKKIWELMFERKKSKGN